MATTNANESRTRDYYKSETGHRTNSGVKPKSKDFKPRNDAGFRGNNSKPRDNYARSGNYKEHNRNTYSYAKNFDKDEEDENKGARSHKADSKSKGSQAKVKEQQPDKVETMKRLEREKKAIQRKNREEIDEKVKRPQVKEKKSTKNNWTRSYTKGMFDEEEIDY